MEGQYEHLLVERRGAILRAVINRPGDRNSINSELMRELTEFLARAENTSARAVIFTGAGDTYFIGGADGIEMMQYDSEGAKSFSQRIQDLFNRMEESPLILVAAINGLCFGGGFEFALACDLRVASKRARIGLPEVKVGLIPGGGGTQRLPRLVGEGKAMEMILSGHLYKGSDAVEMGLVHRVVEHEELLDEADAFLEPILRQPGYVLPLAKNAVHASRSISWETGLKEERVQFSHCFEHRFFVNLMHQQMKEGLLQTTVDISHLKGADEE